MEGFIPTCMLHTPCTLDFGKVYSYFTFKKVLSEVLGFFILGCAVYVTASNSVAFTGSLWGSQLVSVMLA